MHLEHQSPASFDGFVLRAHVLRDLQRTSARYIAPPSVTIEFTSEHLHLAQSTQQTIKMLLDSVALQIVRPALRKTSDEEWYSFLESHWHEFSETLHAFHVVIARGASEEIAAAVSSEVTAEGMRALEDSARELSGERGADEAHFCATTYLNALQLLPKIAPLPDDASTTARDRDRRLAGDFAHAATLHSFGVFALHLACDEKVGPTPVGIRNSFMLLRAGALDAYRSIRCALDLRANDEGDDGEYDALPTDDEDAALADID